MTDEILNTVPDDADVYEATLAFSQALEAAPNDRTLLRRWATRFPEFEADFSTIGFSRFALGLTLADPLAEYEAAPKTEPAARPALAGLISEAGGLSAAEMARFLQIDRTLLLRLEQRLLDAWTLPSALVDRLARVLERTSDEISAYLSGPPKLAEGTHYRARAAPKIARQSGVLYSPVRQPTFADEVRRNQQMSNADKAFWLAEADKEGKGGDA